MSSHTKITREDPDITLLDETEQQHQEIMRHLASVRDAHRKQVRRHDELYIDKLAERTIQQSKVYLGALRSYEEVVDRVSKIVKKKRQIEPEHQEQLLETADSAESERKRSEILFQEFAEKYTIRTIVLLQKIALRLSKRQHRKFDAKSDELLATVGVKKNSEEKWKKINQK
ncbi:hypothetical protein DFH11DRAFT_1550248 [Phellopilus nigrolimitatus]|nr:hypothetical protein DFH11DRAFT_1550248 [Phellopilus nigrolimitatus]